MDKALRLTDKKLEALESKVGRVYKNDPALKQIKKEFNAYMKMVQKRTRSSYEAYVNENDKNTKEELKHVYMDELRVLTLNSVKYRKLIKKFTKVMADVNQKALNLVNAEMSEIYVINYNQIATDCEKIGIKVNG